MKIMLPSLWNMKTAIFMMSLIVMIFVACNRQGGSSVPEKFGFGRVARKEEIRALAIAVMPDGRGLPAGSGNVLQGKLIYNTKCLVCHGNGEKTESPLPGEPLFENYLSGGDHFPKDQSTGKIKTIGNYWPYATTIFDYVRRAMPYNAPGSLSNQEVYHLTAYLLYANRIIPENGVINERSLPKIVMPARKRYVHDDRKGGPELK